MCHRQRFCWLPGAPLTAYTHRQFGGMERLSAASLAPHVSPVHYICHKHQNRGEGAYPRASPRTGRCPTGRWLHGPIAAPRSWRTGRRQLLPTSAHLSLLFFFFIFKLLFKCFSTALMVYTLEKLWVKKRRRVSKSERFTNCG